MGRGGELTLEAKHPFSYLLPPIPTSSVVLLIAHPVTFDV